MTRAQELARAAAALPPAQALNAATLIDFTLERLAGEPEAAVEAIRGARQADDGGAAMAEAYLESLPADVVDELGARAAAAVADQLRIAAVSAVAAENLLGAQIVAGPRPVATAEAVVLMAASPIVAALRAQMWTAPSAEDSS